MRIKKVRVLALIITIISLAFIILNLLTPNEDKVISSVLRNGLVNEFVQTRDENYDIKYISLEELSFLKNSDQYAFYIGLPDRPVYRVLVLEDGDGYMLFLDSQTLEIIKIMGAHNLALI